jgi:anthranilate synthase/aminodeoxychorismate synthase-like glutamine amidotransferase
VTDSPTILVIDNYDSFVYILVQYLGELGASPVVRRHDEIDLDGIRALDPDGMLISPGPGNPDDSGVSMDILTNLTTDTPIFGVCLGMQCMGQAFGGEVVRAPQVMHGKTSMIRHRDVGVFHGLPNPVEATRYHSLIVERDTLPDALEITAETDDGLIMGLRHREREIEGVQFHPESVLTSAGHALITNFIARCR